MVTSMEARFFIVGALFSACAGRTTSGLRQKQIEEKVFEDEPGLEQEGGPNSSKENFFQEIYMLQSAPKQIEFGHVCENPNEWEQRYEKKDFDRNRHQGKLKVPIRDPTDVEVLSIRILNGDVKKLKISRKHCACTATLPRSNLYSGLPIQVRWADKSGGHGEHYWDYNHSGSSQAKKEEEYEASEPDVPSTESPTRQHHKRQLRPVAEEDGPRPREAQEFLRSIHDELMPVFDLELRNKNLFFGQAKTGGPIRFEFTLPRMIAAARRAGSVYV